MGALVAFLAFAIAAPALAGSVSVAPEARAAVSAAFQSPTGPVLPAAPAISLQAVPEPGVGQTISRLGALLVQSAESQRAASAPMALAPGLVARPVKAPAVVARATKGLRSAVVKGGEASGAELDSFYDRLTGRRDAGAVLAAPVSAAAPLAAAGSERRWGKLAAALPVAAASRTFLQVPGFFSVHAHAVAFTLLGLALLVFAGQAYMANMARKVSSIDMDPTINFASSGLYGGLTAITTALAIASPATLGSIFPGLAVVAVFGGVILFCFAVPEDDLPALLTPTLTFALLTLPALYLLGIPLG